MTKLFEHESVFELADTLETVKGELNIEQDKNGQLLRGLQKELFFRWLQFDDELDDCVSGLEGKRYIYVLEHIEAVDFFTLMNLPMNTDIKKFQTALSSLLTRINACSFPYNRQKQLTLKEVENIFKQLERHLGFCTKLFSERPLPVLKIDAINGSTEAQYVAQESDEGGAIDGLILYHFIGEECLQKYSVLRGLGYALCHRLTGQLEFPPDSFQMVERSIYGNCEIEPSRRVNRFIDCFAWCGANAVSGAYCFPPNDASHPNIDQLTYYFKALLESK